MTRRRLSLPLFLTAEQAAEVLNIPTRTVYEKIRQGKLPISPHGKPYRVDRDALFKMARKAADISLYRKYGGAPHHGKRYGAAAKKGGETGT